MPTYAVNKKARFDYEILDRVEAGLVLTGPEVKSVRGGQINLKSAFVSFYGGEVWLTNVHIASYRFAGHLPDYDPDRSRKLLLNKKQITHLASKAAEKGLTIVPLSVYSKGPKIKVDLGVARGKKLYDKRRVIKTREQERETRRAAKGDY